jgi:hypothetical protein
MTRRRQDETSEWLRRFLVNAVALVAFAGCATLPQDQPVYEQLDPETGVTIARVGKPFELYRETVQNVYNDRFAFFAPFETNQMGKREIFLWVAVPMDPSLRDSIPSLEVDGERVELGTAGRAADFAGLAKSPYKTPAPWSELYYFRADDALMARLAAAQTIAIHSVEPAKNGTIATEYALKVGDDPRLKEFAAR